MTTILEATYEHGILRLSEPISLPEGTRVQVTVSDPAIAPVKRPPYPSALEAEYAALIEKELHGTLTKAEAQQLEEVCRVIAEIDRLTLKDDIRHRQLDKIQEELAQLRTEIESLPDA